MVLLALPCQSALLAFSLVGEGVSAGCFEALTMGNGLSQSISRLASKTGCEWPMIESVGRTADDASDKVREALKGDGLVPTDTAFIVFGSLARREMTAGSDLDWTLLVDGQADPQHKRVAKKIEARLVDLGMKEPGGTGLFGGLAFSHQIIQAIGGEPDTNSNTDASNPSPARVVRAWRR